MKRLLVGVILALLLSGPGHTFTRTGVESGDGAHDRMMAKWDLAIHENADYRKRTKMSAVRYAMLFYCHLSDDKIRYAFSFGETTEDAARLSAASAFNSMPGKCTESPNEASMTTD